MALRTNVQAVGARILDELERAVLGKREALDLILLSLLSDGHVLIEDLPGVGKTLIARSFAQVCSMGFARVQFTPDLMPADVTGGSVYDQRTASFTFIPGPVFTNILLADEINRTTPKTQSALLEAMNEYQVTVDRDSHPLPQPFLVIATQNPVEHHGTYPLPESQLDRFLIRAHMSYPEGTSERQILRSEVGAARLDDVRPVLSGADILFVQDEVTRVQVDEALVEYALKIVALTRESTYLSLGVSPRGSMALYRAAQALALLEGRTFTTPEDFKSLAVHVFAHRVVISGRYSSTLKKSDHAEQILRDIIESVPVPV